MNFSRLTQNLRLRERLNGLQGALQFLTTLPAGKPAAFDASAMVPWFPVVGLILGFIVALFDSAALHVWSPPVAAVCDVILLAALSGALHLDGLSDTADGIFSHRPRERALEIMKDSRIGVMGLVAVAACLGLKWGGLAGLEGHRFLGIMATPALARGSMLFGMRFLPYGRPSGTGSSFFDKPLPARAFYPLCIPLFLCMMAGAAGWMAILGFAVATCALLAFFKAKMGCITGDMLGAMGEVNEALALLILSGAWT
ncbi:MAG: adenosylcobinamide-GDP ribazoletransferase [Desulfatibacillum sp.]|nr:adenosylcobinamide-GDP ribazoletransferase [Desulfatibacillum sp.]